MLAKALLTKIILKGTLKVIEIIYVIGLNTRNK